MAAMAAISAGSWTSARLPRRRLRAACGSVTACAGIELPSSSVVAGAMRVGVRSKLMQASGVPPPLYLQEMARLSE